MTQGFGADTAYDRAIRAFDEKSYDVSRRWVLEALAQDPAHARARALLSRLDAVRRPPGPPPAGGVRPASPYGHAAHASAPEPVSTDPTVLISHASRAPAAEPIEPTVMINRDARRAASPDPFAQRRPAPPPPVADPTVIRRAGDPPPPPPRPRTATAAASGGFLQRWKDLFRGSNSPPPAPAAPRVAASRPGGLTPGMRGGALVVGAVAVAALLVWGIVSAARWFWPAGQSLTITKPIGGTIIAPDIQCGTKGDDCATTRPTDEAVELVVQADAKYVFGGYTGDCAPAGRVVMSEPRKCGARFEPAAPETTAVTFPLMITKPVGGTIAGEPNILCGTLDSVCSANIQSGTAVTMRFQADNNFAFQAFTGDCAPNGELTMNAAKTCGAIFMPTQTAVINQTPGTPRSGGTKSGSAGARTTPGEGGGAGRTKSDTGAPSSAVPPPPPPPPPPTEPDPGTTTTGPKPQGPVKDEISAEDHARNEINDLVKRFCAAHETLKVEAIQKMFPLAPVETYRYQFRQYKTLKCSITEKPEFVRLDARPNGAAQVKYGMKQVIQMRIGGQPEVKETIVTMTLSRTDYRTPWLIDRLAAEEKPK